MAETEKPKCACDEHGTVQGICVRNGCQLPPLPTTDPRERGEDAWTIVRKALLDACAVDRNPLHKYEHVSARLDAIAAQCADRVLALRAPAPSEAVAEDERCEVCEERRATIHLEGAVNELCAECHIARLERVVNGPVGEARRLLGAFVQACGDKCRHDHHGFCQAHFLERGDQCTVKLARELLATHPAPARGVTEEQAADVLREMVAAARNGNPLAPILTSAYERPS